MLEDSKWKWVTGSMIYLHIDYLLMFIAMIQTFNFMKYLDQQRENKI